MAQRTCSIVGPHVARIRALLSLPLLALAAMMHGQATARLSAEDSAAGGREFAPYVDMGLDVADNLVAIQQKTGIKAVTLGFIESSGGCAAGWGGLHQALPGDRLANGTTVQGLVKELKLAGVDVIVSFGGQSGMEPALGCKTANDLQSLYQSVIDRYGLKRLDFDIEGREAGNQASIALRDQALVSLRRANPGLVISFTLEVMPTGLSAHALNIVESARRDGLDLDLVNVMAMDYGDGEDYRGQMGIKAVEAAVAARKQIRGAGQQAKVGITVMIGVNDERTEVFNLADAQKVLQFARENAEGEVARLSIWSLERDNGSCAGRKSAAPTCSGLRQPDYEFTETLKAFTGESGPTAGGNSKR